MLNLNRIILDTRAEGPGKRCSIWLQGCARHCEGCFAKDTWSFEPRQLYSADALANIILNQSGIEGLTVLGGEPMAQAEELSELIRRVKSARLSVILFTGYRYDQLTSAGNPFYDRILQNVDVLVDGEFILEQRELSRPMVGSSNQRFHFLSNRYTMADFPSNTIEVRISKSGKISVNGMGELKQLNLYGGDES